MNFSSDGLSPKDFGIRFIGILGLLFFITGYLFGPVMAEEKKGPSAKDLERITVRSSRFPSGSVTFRNGEYRASLAPASASEMVVKLVDPRSSGLVNGKETAAIVFVTNTGGSGMFYDLALLVKRKEGWLNVDTVPLGDRVKVHSVVIKDSRIIVSMTAHGPGDPMCCPTQEMTRRFTVKADRLREERDTRSGTQSPVIIGQSWQWVKTRYGDGTAIERPAGAAGYTLQLNPDGTVMIRADCNGGGGSFTTNGGKLSIIIAYSTMAACPEGSLEGPYIFDLSRVDGFLFKDGRLYLDLKLDSGTMEFEKR